MSSSVLSGCVCLSDSSLTYTGRGLLTDAFWPHRNIVDNCLVYGNNPISVYLLFITDCGRVEQSAVCVRTKHWSTFKVTRRIFLL